MRPPAVLSVQSRVVYGHVGHSAGQFALQRLGCEVWPVDTVVLSNHPGHGRFRGGAVAADRLAELVAGLDELGVLGRCDALFSGYLGTAEAGEAVLGALARLRRVRPQAPYVCDPVMGDEGRGFFVRPGLPEFFRERAVPAAGIVLPNAFEAAFLAGRPCGCLDEARAAAAAIRALGPRVAVITGLALPGDRLGALASTAEGAWLAAAPRLRAPANGAGDLFSAAFLAHWLKGAGVAGALAAALSGTWAVLRASAGGAEAEFDLVAAQDRLAAPETLFTAEPVG